MTSFVLKTVDAAGRPREFLYNNQSSSLTDTLGRPVTPVEPCDRAPFAATGRKSPVVKHLKIQLGLSCNYSCEYCSQRFVPHADPTGPYSVDTFMSRLIAVMLADDATVEFWGGEPMVYWKTLVPLVDRLRMRYPALTLRMITNGSLLDHMKASWLISNGFHLAISHDGPGQKTRGPDPLEDRATREAVLMLYQRLRPLDRISFNAMIHRDNQSRAAVQEYFVKLTGDESVPIGEGMFIDSYDAGGKSQALAGASEHGAYRRLAYDEVSNGHALNFANITRKIVDFGRSVRTARQASSLGQKCGADREDTLTVDLEGNVLTCQNVSSVSIAPNGKSHCIGNINAISSVQLDSARHWSTRANCASCPVLQLCKGSCMFLEGELWDVTCESAYSDNVVFFATAVKELTGCTLQRIEPMTGHLPEHRQNVFAPQDDTRHVARQIIPIHVSK